MHPVACAALSKNAVMVQGRHRSILVLSRGMSRSSTRPLRLSSTSNKSKPPPRPKPIHSSAKRDQSTPPLSLEQQTSQHATQPTSAQLKVLFTASAVPMIGFGFMDNLVMIQAGQFIDNTIGVTMGLATMTAAAAGQVVSDVSGVIFGGSLERFLHRYKLIKASTLTTAQRTLPVCRNVALLGAVCGVALGCGLGASCLLFMDLEARERAERAMQLQAVLNDMMMEAESACTGCTIHVAADQHFSGTPYSREHGKTQIDVLSLEGNSLAAQSARAGTVVQTDSVLCTPIVSHEGEVVAVLEFHADQGFTPDDEKTAKVMARHIGIFMHRLSQ